MSKRGDLPDKALLCVESVRYGAAARQQRILCTVRLHSHSYVQIAEVCDLISASEQQAASINHLLPPKEAAENVPSWPEASPSATELNLHLGHLTNGSGLLTRSYWGLKNTWLA